jgi:RimJ/RimL family protein N-acetyltransferase
MQRLETERLILRPLTAEDAAFVLAVLNDPGYLANIADRGVRTVEDAAAYIGSAQVFRYGPDGLGFNVVELRETGEPVGICGLVKRDTLDDLDVGYAILEPFSGYGYAREAGAAALAHALGPLGLARVVAITSPENAGSRRVLERIGMRYEGLLEVPGYDSVSCLYAAGRSGVGSAQLQERAS